MDGIVEENGQVDPLSGSPDPQVPIASSVGLTNTQPHLVAATNIVQLTLPAHSQAQVQSVIQPNQQSVIQTAANIQPMLSKNVILVSKPNSVIQTTQGSLQALRVVETGSDDSFSEEESPKKRRDLLTRRPSYRKILNDLGGGEIAEGKIEQTSSEADSELSSHSIPYHTVLPATAIQITSGEGGQGIHTLTMTNATAGGAIVQYAQGQEFFVPGKDLSVLIDYASSHSQAITAVKTELADDNSVVEYQEYPYDETSSNTSGPQSFSTLKLTEIPKSPDSPPDRHPTTFQVVAQGGSIATGGGEDQARKREMRLQKNREAARECRRKKKEYIKCLENRVAVLENQNKTLIEELKSLKELYCQQKTE